jgi:hypothetical protein
MAGDGVTICRQITISERAAHVLAASRAELVGDLSGKSLGSVERKSGKLEADYRRHHFAPAHFQLAHARFP